MPPSSTGCRRAGRTARAGGRHPGPGAGRLHRGHRHGRGPGRRVRRKKDSSLVRAAELVRDGKASAMVSAGNTGATMASALLRMGRLPGVVRPCIATPLPRLGRTPAVLVDAGANAECTPAMLVQFAQMGAAYVVARFGTESPSVGLLSIGEEPTKGTPLVKETHGLLAGRLPEPTSSFVGNLEGRDLLPSPADVIVTDGFTGQRDAQDAGGLAALPLRHHARRLRHRRARPGGGRGAAARTCSRWPPSSSPRTPAGRCCSGSTASASSATGPRCDSHDERGAAWPTSARTRGLVDHVAAAVAFGPISRKETSSNGTNGPSCRASKPYTGPVPAETHTNQGPLDRKGCSS